jgi:hypothetical protein
MAKVQYSIKLDQEILDGIQEVAKKQFRSVNNAIELAIKEYVEQNKD